VGRKRPEDMGLIWPMIWVINDPYHGPKAQIWRRFLAAKAANTPKACSADGRIWGGYSLSAARSRVLRAKLVKSRVATRVVLFELEGLVPMR